MLEMEKANLLGLGNPGSYHLDSDGVKSKIHSPLERMQIFLQTVHENCYHILGNAGPSLGKDFYQIPQLSTALISVIFNNLEVSFRFYEIESTAWFLNIYENSLILFYIFLVCS